MALKCVLITGCSIGGIGSALVLAFQKRNLHVFATARTLSKMSHLKDLPNVTLLILDVTSPSAIATAVEAVKARTGGTLDYLINNSGSSYVMPMLDVNVADAKDMFDVNFWSVLAVIQAFAPLLIASQGSVVNICSISAYVNAPWMGVYGASKAALTLLSETLRLEMAPFGVKVVAVVTGAVQTNIMINGPEPELPSTSRYKSAEPNILARARGEDVKSKMKNENYAEKVVGDILSGADGKIWRGELALMVRYASAFPLSFVEGAVLKGTGLDTFPKSI